MLNKLNDCIKKLNYYKLEDVLISCFWRSRELHNQINFNLTIYNRVVNKFSIYGCILNH